MTKTPDLKFHDTDCTYRVTAEAIDEIECLTDELREARAEIERYRNVLELLARLGNGDHYGNSDGNRIAQQALANNQEAE